MSSSWSLGSRRLMGKLATPRGGQASIIPMSNLFWSSPPKSGRCPPSLLFPHTHRHLANRKVQSADGRHDWFFPHCLRVRPTSQSREVHADRSSPFQCGREVAEPRDEHVHH